MQTGRPKLKTAPDFEALINTLHEHKVEFVIVGGFAGNLHGAARVTYDLDIVYERSRQNLKHLAEALAPLTPYPRDAPPGLPFMWDAKTLDHGLNFTLTTDLGDLDLFGEITGVGGFANLLPGSIERVIFGVPCRCISLADLIASKQASGRAKDYESIAELKLISRQSDL